MNDYTEFYTRLCEQLIMLETTDIDTKVVLKDLIESLQEFTVDLERNLEETYEEGIE